jgi:tetratricopeptide (TPR) repeat protein
MSALRLPFATNRVVLISASLALVAVASGGWQRPTASTVIALARWVRAVNEHVPGQRDSALDDVLTWTSEVRDSITEGLVLFVKALTGKGAMVSTDEDKAIVDLGVTQSQTVGPNVFVDRAAVLYADAVVLQPVPIDRSSSARAHVPSPLFPANEIVLANDGNTQGVASADWRWTFARSLLELGHPKPAGDPFVADWYHATAVYLMNRRSWGEARHQLDRAGVLFPDDPRILFDRGCLSEIMGLPESQVLLTHEDLVAMRMRSVPDQRVLPNSPQLSHTARQAGIPPVEVANAEAERLFRRVLELDSTQLEARVRLARLLEVRGQYAEAARQLDIVLKADAVAADRVLLYEAHLFAGRAQAAIGQLDRAATHLKKAREIFPPAQSVMIAASALALQRGQADDAMALLRQLADMPADPSGDSDPWRQYDQGPGRRADVLLTQLRALASALGR